MSEYRRRQAWNAGAKAARSGKSEYDNDRQPGTIYHDDWLDGFEQTAREMDQETNA